MTTKELTKHLKRIEQQIYILRQNIMNLPDYSSRSDSALRKAVRETAGILKNKLPKDPIAWQRRMRAQWDKRFN